MIRAVIVDTWRQSKQQVVFIVMLALMALALVVGTVLPRPIVDDDGEKHFGTVLSERPADFFAQQWLNEYARTIGAGTASVREAMQGADQLGPAERQQRMQEFMAEQRRLREEAVNRATSIPEYQRSVEYFIYIVVSGMFKVTMLLFIAACAGYFPAMLGSGAVDIVLAKPVSRLRIYLARYVGGITLYAAAIVAFCALLFVGVGLRTGIFHWRLFSAIPLLCFTAMLLYALLALVGTISRSATMAMVTGYAFYVVVDTAIAYLLNNQLVLQRVGWESVVAVCDALRHVLPNFGMLNELALATLLHIPKLEVGPFAVALAWLVGSLALGCWIFRRRDY